MNLGTLTPSGSGALIRLDQTLVGTDAYLGVAYFWGYAYRYPMRDLTPSARRRVHALMLERGLPLDGESAEHLAAVQDALTSRDHHALYRAYGREWAA